MAGIDSRIVIVGLPQVASSLGADAEQAIWITQAYVLGSTVALLLIGRISDIVGRVKLYTSGFAVFTIGSLLTSLAVNPAQVIAFRAIQGLGSAILFTNSAAMIVDATPADELGLSLGINQVAFRMGSMAGLTVSGIILSVLDWRALFYVNVPIGAFGAVLLLVSLYFQLVLRKSPLEAGLLIIPMDIATLAAGPLSGRLSDKYGHLPFTTAGLATISLSLVLFATTDANTPYSLFVVYLILFGAGLGFFASPNISSIMGSVPPERRGIASGFRATFFNVGYTISLNLAILITTFTVPYALVTQVIGSGGTGISEADRILFAQGLNTTYLSLAGLNTLAILPSMLRGRRANAREPKAAPTPET